LIENKQEPQDTINLEELEKENFDLRQLLEISKSLSSNLDYLSLLDSILYICMGQMGVTQAAIFSSDNLEAKRLKMMRNLEGFELDSDRKYVIHTNKPLSSYLTSNPGCYTIRELQTRVIDEENLQILRSLQPTLIVPLIVKKQLLGLIILGERIRSSEYTVEEKEYLLNIAYFAANAVHNAVLFEMSTTDLMTRLKQKHYFFTILEKRLLQSSQEKKNVSLIMADIDHFKNINDTYGHQVGDEVLKTVSSIIRGNLRPNDIGARYGGEEFVILVQDADEQKAYEIAERLRLKAADFNHTASGCRKAVYISLGVAEYIPDIDSSKSLLQKVDQALYASKQNGRNRTTKYSEMIQ